MLRPSELREVLELDRARKGVERQIIHNNQVNKKLRVRHMYAFVTVV